MTRPRKQNREAKVDISRRFREKNPERCRLHRQRYLSSEKGKAWKQRDNFKRRNLGGILFFLNQKQPGLVLHHVEQEIGIWLPPHVHASVWHNLTTGKGMVEMNEKASEYLRAESK